MSSRQLVFCAPDQDDSLTATARAAAAALTRPEPVQAAILAHAGEHQSATAARCAGGDGDPLDHRPADLHLARDLRGPPPRTQGSRYLTHGTGSYVSSQVIHELGFQVRVFGVVPMSGQRRITAGDPANGGIADSAQIGHFGVGYWLDRLPIGSFIPGPRRSSIAQLIQQRAQQERIAASRGVTRRTTSHVADPTADRSGGWSGGVRGRVPQAVRRLSGFLADFGDGVRLAAFPLLAAQLTRSPVAVAAVTAVQGLPWLLASAGLGVVVDRADRRRLMIIAARPGTTRPGEQARTGSKPPRPRHNHKRANPCSRLGPGMARSACGGTPPPSMAPRVVQK